MLLNGQALEKALAQPLAGSVYYFYSTEEYPVRRYTARALEKLLAQEGDAEVTRIDGASPSIEEAVAAAGTISLFGARRIVSLPAMEPSTMPEADVAALCDLLQSLENAVVVMGTVYRDEKAMGTKKAKQLIAAADKAGAAALLTKPSVADLRRFVQDQAREQGAGISAPAASELIERCGQDPFVLENEVCKLAAACGYGEITSEWIERAATQSIEANVFDMVRLVSTGSLARAMEKLSQLLDLGNEPIAIVAALTTSFIDMYRIRCAPAGRGAGAVHKDFGGKGSDYRMRKAAESASRYSRAQIEAVLQKLLGLDAALKSSAVEGAVLLETALCEIQAIGGRR